LSTIALGRSSTCRCRSYSRLVEFPAGVAHASRVRYPKFAATLLSMTALIRLFLFIFLAASLTLRAADYPPPTEGDYVIRDFKFISGGTMPELKIHYRTIGKAVKDEKGVVRNAVLITHGTTGSGAQFIRPEFAGELFG